ncbi:MAG: response regulator [Candidatus Cloacimonetes bacterium]|nr:response regulator [Candidatus Cloacimonadota bacterium]
MQKILAIDDKQDNLEAIKALLHHLMPECRVLTALSGAEGIELARIEKPDTIILDIIMPQMDGYEVCRILKDDEETRHIPVLMLTAIKTDTESRIKGLQHGADAFFSKPIDPYELSAQISVMLRIKNSEDRLRRDKLHLLESVDEKTKALLENEVKLNQILDGFPIPAFVMDKEHRISHWNKALARLTGLSATEMIGTDEHWKFLYQEKKPLLADLLLEKATEEEITRYFGAHWQRSRLLPDALQAEMVFLNKQDQDIWHYITAVPVKDEEGNTLGALQTIQDITLRKRAEIELTKHKEHLEELVAERTRKLEEKNQELEQMNRLFVGREFRIKELRDKMKILEEKIRKYENTE